MDWLFEKSDNPVLKFKKTQNTIETNPAFREMFGLKNDVAMETLFEKLPNFPKFDRLNEGSTYQDDQNRDFLIEKSPEDWNGDFYLLFRKHPRKKLQELGQELVLNHIDLGVIIVDNDCKIVSYNNHQLQFDGFVSSEIIGRTTWEVENIDPKESGLERVLKSGNAALDYEHHFNAKLNRYVTMEGRLFPLIRHGQVIGAVGIYKRLSTFDERMLGEERDEKKRPKKKEFYTFSDIIGNSQKIKESVDMAKKASQNDSSVFIFGETGVGKELFAQSIHTAGPRKKGPFIAINCSAIPETLFESMLFGNTKGAFTGSENSRGLLEMADGGTLLFDEINSMPLHLQNKLLRVIEERSVRPLGSKREVYFDTRIISCSTEDPEKLISQNKMRRDLYYRLAVMMIKVPNLKSRPEDILLYARSFITFYNNVFGKTILSIHPETAAIMTSYSWPGNVRQLRHYIECIMNTVSSNEHIFSHYAMPSYFNTIHQIDHQSMGHQTPLFIADPVEASETTNHENPKYPKNDDFHIEMVRSDIESSENSTFFDDIKRQEKQQIMDALIKTNGNVSKAGRLLKLSRRQIQYRIEKFGLK